MSGQIEGQCPNCGHKVIFTLDQEGGHISCFGCSITIDPKTLLGQLVEMLDRLDKKADQAPPKDPC
ncbi:MAG: hypothetical protein LBC90_01465 [Candidatus Adiutrix sp.]|jgi:DNA-directed RNA polymerase subunit RPC12/RpoP|nr:hypothetical protein [Candidatus Adiutrix sp.]